MPIVKKTLQEMNLLDDFLFGKMVTYPGIGERFCKHLVSAVLGVELTHIKIVPQKVYYGANVDMHGARLDIYIEESESDVNGTVFDFEPDKNDKGHLKKALPQRVRFYHAMIDHECLKSGKDYATLKRVIVILMMPYDPFGYDHIVYTIKNHCEEVPDMPYDDGAKTIFLYTKGQKGHPTRKLQELLRYMEESTKENVCNEMLEDIHEMVTKVRCDKEVTIEYMKIFEREKMIYDDGKEEGLAEGRAEGIRNMVSALEELRVPLQEILSKVQEKYQLTPEEARTYLKG